MQKNIFYIIKYIILIFFNFDSSQPISDSSQIFQLEMKNFKKAFFSLDVDKEKLSEYKKKTFL